MIFLSLSMNSCFVSCKDVVYSPTVAIDFSKFSESDGYENSNNGGALLGPQLGIDLIAPINEQLSLESGLRFAGKGNKTSFEGQESEGAYSFEDKIRLNYLDVPLLARYQLGKGGFSIYGGVQPSLLISAKQKGEGTGSESQNTDVKDSYKSLDMAGSIGMGYEFTNGLRVNLGYDHGFANIADNSAFGAGKINNRTFKLSLGYKFGKKK